MDMQTIRTLFQGAGMDTRQWFSLGFVRENAGNGDPVRFKDENGTLIPEGPLVDVVLQPSGIEVTCRVGHGVAGEGEGEWHPFLERDEVGVLIPEGDERAGCVIICRLNSGIDTFPANVAGADTSKNNFAFKRVRPPYIVEVGTSYLLHNATTGAQFALTQEGNVIFNDGEGSRFMMLPQVAGFALPGDAASFQLLADGSRALITAGDGTMSFLLDSDLSKFITPGVLNFGTSGFAGVGHGVTVEQVVVLIEQVLTAIFTVNGGAPGTTPLTNGMFNPAGAAALMTTALGTVGAFPINPLYTAALALTMAIPPDPLGIKPGLGRAGFVL